MADRDNRIRIIVEGIDRLSGPLDRARKSLRQFQVESRANKGEFPLFGGGYAKMNEETKKFERVLTRRQKAIKSYIDFVNAQRNKARGVEAERWASGIFKDPETGKFKKDLTLAQVAYRNTLGQMAKDTREFSAEFQKSFAISGYIGEETKKAIGEFDKFKKEALASLTEDQDKERAEIEKTARKRREKEYERMDELRAINRQISRDIKKTKDEEEIIELEGLRDINKAKIREIRDALDETERIEGEALKRRFQRQRIEVTTRTRSDFISQAVRADILSAGDAIDELDSKWARAGRRAGRSAGDFVKGFKVAKEGVEELTEVVRRDGSKMQRFGLAVGEAVTSVNKFINLRWLFITGIITIFLAVIVRLGAALVALAASAIQAGAALGGAFVAGVSQAIPAIGLLAAAMQRLSIVMDAVKLSDKNSLRESRDLVDSVEKKRQAVQRLSDAQYSLKTALEGVGDAEYGIKKASDTLQKAYKDRTKAIKDLADARIKAQQDIVDANLAEKDAALSLAEAELAVLDAKERLRKEQEKKTAQGTDLEGARLALKDAQERLKLVKAQGDQAEISAAAQQVSIAQQNLSAVESQAAEVDTSLKDAQLAVKRAEINRQQAVIRDKRAKQDAAKKRKQGVEGSDGVVSAKEQLESSRDAVVEAQRGIILSNRQLRDSIRGVAVARRELRDAEIALADKTNFLTSQQNQLNEALADLSPSERKVYEALKRVKDAYQKIFSGDNKTDGILGPINESIAKALDGVLVLLKDPEIQKALKGLSKEIGKSIEAISKFTLTPEFKEFLLFFIQQSKENLPGITKAFLNITEALLRIAKAAAPLFKELLDRFVGFTDRIVNITRDSKKLEDFFASAGKYLDSWIDFGKALGNIILALTGGAAPSGKSLLDDITDKLNEWAEWIRENPEATKKFFDDLIESLENLAAVFGKFLPKFVEAFASDNFTDFSKLMLEVVIPGLLMMIQLLGLASKLLTSLFEIPVVGDVLKIFVQLAVAEKALNKIFPLSQRITVGLRNLATKGFFFLFNAIRNPRSAIQSVRSLFDTIILKSYYARDALKKTSAAFADFFKKIAATTVGQKIIGVFSALAAGIRVVGLALKSVFFTPPYILLLIGAIVTAIVLLDRKFHFLRPTIKFIWKLLKEVFQWAKDHWKLLLAIFLGPFGLAAAAIFKWKDKIIGFFKAVIDWIKDNWKKLLMLYLLAPFGVGGFIVGAVIKFKDKILGIFDDLVTGIKNKFGSVVGWVEKKWTNLKNFLGSLNPFGGGDGPSDKEKTTAQTQVVNYLSARGNSKLITAKRAEGLSDQDILRFLVENGFLKKDKLGQLFKLALAGNLKIQKKRFGGPIEGGMGTDTVPAMLTPGEWVVNASQQRKLASSLGMTVAQAQAFLFGTNMGTVRPGESTTRTRPSRTQKPRTFGDYTLVPQEDPNGVTVWFIEMADGTFGQVTAKDAQKIQASEGRYIPGYVKRNSHGFKQNIYNIPSNRMHYSAVGGVVPAVARFAAGGIVQNPGFSGGTGRGGAVVNQNFNVSTQGETDWNYVMRLGAISAQGSF